MVNNTKIKICYCHFYLNIKELVYSLKIIKKIFNNVDIIIITNNINIIANINIKLNDITVVQGTNRLFDFSAYYEGYKINSSNNSNILFLNDTLFIKYPFKWMLNKMMIDIKNSLDSPLKVPLVISFSADYNYFLTRNPWSNSYQHICTAFFYTNYYAVRIFIDLIEFALRTFLPEDILLENKILQNTFIDIFGEKFYAYISILLFSEGFWFPDKEVQVNHKLISLKAICYYLEHRFSGKIDELNGGFIYINRGKNSIIFRSQLFMSQLIWKIKNRKR